LNKTPALLKKRPLRPAAPSISAIAPSDTVTITGAGFSATLSGNTVTFNGVAAKVTAATATQLTVTVPPNLDTSNPAQVAVTVANKTATAALPAINLLPAYAVSTLAGGDTSGFADGPGSAAKFSTIHGMAVDPFGNIVVAEANHRVRMITQARGVAVSTLAGNTSGSVDGRGPTAKFMQPVGVAVDGKRAFIVTDMAAVRVRKITISPVLDIVRRSIGDIPASSVTVSTIAGNESGLVGSGVVDGPVATALFWSPFGVAIDTAGNIYVADINCIRKITPSGIVSTLAGTTAMGLTDGVGAAARFHGPHGMATDAADNLYVADAANHCIRKITPGGKVSTLAGSTTPGFVNGTGAAARFNQPNDVAVDKADNVYVADMNNHCIRKITPNGVVSTVTGNGKPGYVDGWFTAAQFSKPVTVAIDTPNNLLYVGEPTRVRKIQLGPG
jgi:hypothetical protein